LRKPECHGGKAAGGLVEKRGVVVQGEAEMTNLG